MSNCNFELGELLHLSNDGGIYRLLNGGNKAVKLIKEVDNDEGNITILAADINVAPKVFGSCFINNEGIIYFALIIEYIDDAKSINQMLIEDKINLKMVKDVKQLVDVMYNNGITHNDLHGDNIIFDGKNGRPYIIDFGMSTLKNKSIESEKRDYTIELSGPYNTMVTLDLKNNTLTKYKYNFKTNKITTLGIFNIIS
jgi:tRNA A-37 threonylcarbamoyl transferase component Bud32